MKKISLFTDLTKHREFINELNNILNLDNSTIKNCYLDYQINRKMAIIIESFNNVTNNSRDFSFTDFFLRAERDDADFYPALLKKGFSKKDIDLLIELFDKYTFDNHYEGMFFATRLSAVTNPNTQENRIVFKFTEDEESDRFIVNNIPSTKSYVVIYDHEISNIFFRLKPDDFSESGYHKIKGPFSQLINNINKNDAIKQLKKMYESGKTVYALEIYKGFLSYDVYVNNFLFFDGQNIITKTFENWNQH